MSFVCPGSSRENCLNCEYGSGGSGNGACSNSWVCGGDCEHCDDVSCDNYGGADSECEADYD